MKVFSDDVISNYVEMGAWERVSWGERFDNLVEQQPDRMAVVDDPRRVELTSQEPQRFTYRELAQRVDRLSQILTNAGLAKGDVVLTQLPNIWEAVALILMAARTGIIVSPTPVQYRAKELRDIIEISSPKAAITVGAFHRHDHAAMMEGLLPSGTPLFTIGPSSTGTPLDLDMNDPNCERPALVTEPDDVLTLCWTSGTENQPKAVPRTHNNWLTNAFGIINGGQLPQGCVFLNPFPVVNMASIAGQLFPAIYLGGTHVLHHPFDIQTFLKQIETEKINYTIVAPALLARMAKHPEMLADTDLSSLFGLGSGSAPLDPWMVRTFQEKFGIVITNFFGSNEGVSLTSGTLDMPEPEMRALYFPRAGRPDIDWKNPAMNWSKTRIVDPDTGDEITETGKAGELQIKGPSIFPGYFRKEGLVRSGFTDDGYYCSGDLFEIVEVKGKRHYYQFVGRKREIIIRGGMNISPVEIDSLLMLHPGLTDVAVASYPDPVLGERICAFVVPRDGTNITLEDLTSFLSDNGLAKYKWPERLEIVDQLPRNSLNKVVRRTLADLIA